MNQNLSKSVNEPRPIAARTNISFLAAVASLLIFSMVAAFYVRHPLFIGGETSLYLVCARALINGQTPFVDFLISDWPTTIVTALVPAMINQFSHVPATLVFNLCALGGGLVSTTLCGFLLLPLRHHPQWQCFPLLIISLAATNAILLYQVGQPQYLMFFALAPYIVLRWLRSEGEQPNQIIAVLTGLFAAFVLTLDPLTIVVPVALEIFWLLSKSNEAKRGLAAESLSCIFGFILIYIAMAFFANQNQIQTFWNVSQPTMAWNTQHIDVTTVERLAAPDRRDIVLPGSILSFVAMLLSQRCTLLSPFAIVFFCGLLVAAIEQQGLSRQYLLMLGSSTTISALIIGVASTWLFKRDKLTGLAGSLSRNRTAMTALLVLLPASACWFIIHKLEQRSTIESWTAVDQINTSIGTVTGIRELVAKYSNEGEPILFLQKRSFPAFPLTPQANRSPCNRFFDSGCIASLADAPEELQRSESTKLCSLLKHDISVKKPALIFIEDGTMRDKLKESGVLDSIEVEYSNVGSWRVDSVNLEPLEFFGTRLPVHAYIRKDRLSPPSEGSQP